MKPLIAYLFAFFSTVGFAVIFNTPKREILFTGFVGVLGWFCYTALNAAFTSTLFSAFGGAFAVGLFSEMLARLRHQPVIIFEAPGIIPLVPGYGLYYTMVKIIEKNYREASDVGFETMLIAVGIASAVIIAATFGNLMRRGNKRLR